MHLALGEAASLEALLAVGLGAREVTVGARSDDVPEHARQLMLAALGEAPLAASFQLQRGGRLPLSEASVDSVSAMGPAVGGEAGRALTDEIVRVLRPGGAVFVAGARSAAAGAEAMIQQAMGRDLRVETRDYRRDGPLVYSAAVLRKELD
jgi:hypothetical protein